MSNKRLIIDIGNTAIELAVFENEKLVEFIGFFQLKSQINELKLALQNCKDNGLSVSEGMIFSVVPKYNMVVSKLIKKYFGFSIKVFDWKNYKLEKKDPRITEAIGADLLADIKSGEVLGGTCLIADCGTITKLLFLDEKSNFVGLSLLPGVEVLTKLFKSNTALLPGSECIKTAHNFGLNTIDSMNHGVLSATVSYIKNAFESIDDKDKKLVITGGNLRFIKNEFKGAIIDKDFTLKGMNILFGEVSK